MKRIIYATREPHLSCGSCGKSKAKRKRKAPAPIIFVAGPICVPLCMTCAKKISSVLDAVIERIEDTYEN